MYDKFMKKFKFKATIKFENIYDPDSVIKSEILKWCDENFGIWEEDWYWGFYSYLPDSFTIDTNNITLYANNNENLLKFKLIFG